MTCLWQYLCTSHVCFEPLEQSGTEGEHVWQARLEDLTIARKERHAVAQAHHRTPRSRHGTSELHLSTRSEDGAACFDNFDDVGARDDTLARIRELATGLGANFDGHAVSTLLR